MTPSDKGWSANYSNKVAASIDDAKFIYDQAEKKLKEILSIGDLIVSRTTTLITLITALLVGLIGYAVNRYSNIHCHCHTDTLFAVASTTSGYLFFVLIYASTNFLGKRYRVLGASPKKLFDNVFFEGIEGELRSKMFIWTQIENYQDSIEFNEKKNKKRWQTFNISVILVMLIPVIILLTYLFFAH
jgi:hypothetical protein